MDNKKQKKVELILIYTLLIVIVIITAIVLGLDMLQREAFFHPWHDKKSYDELKKISDVRKINIKDNGVNLNGWFWDIQKKDNAPLVIFFGGNMQNSSNTIYNYYVGNKMKEVFGQYNLLMVDYPGYGKSKGKPLEKSLFKASKAIFEYA